MNDPVKLVIEEYVKRSQVLMVYKTIIYLPQIGDDLFIEGKTYTVYKRKFIYNAVGEVSKIILKVTLWKKR